MLKFYLENYRYSCTFRFDLITENNEVLHKFDVDKYTEFESSSIYVCEISQSEYMLFDDVLSMYEEISLYFRDKFRRKDLHLKEGGIIYGND